MAGLIRQSVRRRVACGSSPLNHRLKPSGGDNAMTRKARACITPGRDARLQLSLRDDQVRPRGAQSLRPPHDTGKASRPRRLMRQSRLKRARHRKVSNSFGTAVL